MSAHPDRLSFAEFIAWESRQEGRYEFADGEIQAMSGGTADHTRIADNIRAVLNAAFGRGPCYAYGSDRKVRVRRERHEDSSRYPDATVTCSESDHGRSLVIETPVVIVEVLSETAVHLDTVVKSREYRAIASFAQYVVVDSRDCWALSYVRSDRGWDAHPCDDGRVLIAPFGVTMSFGQMYAGTSLEDRVSADVE